MLSKHNSVFNCYKYVQFQVCEVMLIKLNFIHPFCDKKCITYK